MQNMKEAQEWPQWICLMEVGAPNELNHVKHPRNTKGVSWVQEWGTHFNHCFEQEEKKAIGLQLWADG